MTSRTSCSDRTLCRKTMRRFWPLWLGYLTVWIFALPVRLHAELTRVYLQLAPPVRAQEVLYGVASHAIPILVFCMAPLAAMAVFSYLYDGKRAGVFASFPIRRERSFFALTMAGLLPMLATPVLAAALAALSEASRGFVDWTPILTCLGVAELCTLSFYGFAVLCAQLTGHLLIVPVVYVVLEFTVPVVEMIVGGLISTFVYGYQTGGLGIGAYLSPMAAVFRFTGYAPVAAKEDLAGWWYYGWETHAAYAAVGLVFLVLALLLYRRRRMETAGDVVAVRPLKKVFAFALGGGCALVLSVVFSLFFFEIGRSSAGRFPIVAVAMLLGGFLGYFGAEMLMRKTFRVFSACWKGFLILAAVLMAFLCAIRFDLLGWERRLPKAADVESVQIHVSQYDAELRDPENVEAVLRLNDDVIACRSEEDPAAGRFTDYLRVTYLLRNGGQVDRFYDRIPAFSGGSADGERIAGKLDAVLNSDEAMAQRFPREVDRSMFHYTEVTYWDGAEPERRPGYLSVELTPEEVYEWYTLCILPDVADGTLGRADVSETEEPYNVTCYLEIYDERVLSNGDYTRDNYHFVRIVPNARSVRTGTWLMEHGVPLNPAGE